MSATSTRVFKRNIRLAILGLLAASAALCAAAALIPHAPRGLNAEYFSGTEFAGEPQSKKVERWIAVNSNEIRADRPTSIRWSGFIWVGTPGDYEFTLDSPGLASLSLDNGTLLDVPSQIEQSRQSAHVTLTAGAHPVTLEFRKPPRDPKNFFHVNLRWKPPGGWEQDVPGSVLFPSAPSSDEVRRANTVDFALTVAGWALAAAVALMGFAGARYLARRMTRRQTLWLGLIYCAALVLRLWYLSDLQARDPFFNALPLGTDHRGYESQARRVLKGTWPDEPFYFQPGQPFYLALIHGVAGEDLFATRAAQAAVGALGVLLAYHLGQAMFDERAGWIAAGLYAAYPIFIFYDAALVATSGATLFMLLALVAAQRAAWPHASQPAWAFTSGLMLGLGGAFQPALLT
ncbi:MAG: glycosyltransferase family 39 protein, partial [Chloroflexi bacterium]|nr:glycosyltransferase family 39 protein [Chloroflexota bacterium]